MTDRWTHPAWRAGGAEDILFCFPHAGAGASVYRRWTEAFAPSIAVCPLQLPGRENRIRETGGPDVAEIAAAIRRRADRPYAVYGHSMGAWIGFEVVRELCRDGGARPRGLFVSAADPPDAGDGYAVRLAGLDDDDLLAELTRLGGVDPEVLEHPELVAFVLPTIRVDLRWLAARTHHPEAPLDIPVVAVAGAADPIVPAGAMEGWRRQTARRFSLHLLPGGHFAPHDQVSRLAAIVRRELSSAT